jgi:Cu/Ag efflux pump CusA
MPGFFSWLEELGRPVNDVDLLGIDVEVREVPSKDDYRAFERTGKSTVSVHFKDGTDQRKTFTDEELQHGGHK